MSEEHHAYELIQHPTYSVILPESALKFLLEFLYSLSKGKAVSILPIESEISTQQAADILNISRPHLVKMLENDEIPYHKVGRHRRINAKDLIEYKRQRDEEREGLLDDLASQAQELDMGY